MSSEPVTLPERVAQHALAHPELIALRFLHYGAGAPLSWSYAELVSRARAVAGRLQARGLRGQPVLLLFPAGPEYLCALLACLQAGAIAVPAYPPSSARLGRANRRIATILQDTAAHSALCSNDVAALAPSLPELAALELLTLADCLRPDAERSPLSPPAPHEPCILQYTSGSVGTPKGVVISHAQLLTNLQMMARVFGSGSATPPAGPIVTWLPPYHDMGLIGTLLSALYEGIGIVQLAPEAFIRKPARWLRAISDQRAAFSVAPNFALDLSVSRVGLQERAGLDLSSLRVLITGAEPVRAQTLERFCQSFEPHGLSRDALCPAYGMAEAVLLVAGARGGGPRVRELNAAFLQRGLATPAEPQRALQRLVSCGSPVPPLELCVVQPESGIALGERELGELWLRGPSISSGYYRKPAETQHAFGAERVDRPGERWLRTGDLGFMADGELFVVGRLKETLIVRGLKHHPHDLEHSAQRSHPALIRDAGAVFALPGSDEEPRIALVQELDTRGVADASALIRGILRAVQQEHELTLSLVLLVKRGSIAKTSSGKIMRGAVCEAVQAGALEPLARWEPSTSRAASALAASEALQPAAAQSQAEMLRLVCELLTARSSGEPVGPDARLYELGIDSLAAVELSEQLARKLGKPVSPSLFYEHASLRELARALSSERPLAAVGGETSQPAAPRRAADQEAAPQLAIVGMSCRFPGADDLEELWQLLDEGRCALGPASRERSRSGAPLPRAGYLRAIDGFDCGFFGLPLREASRMDPQQLLVLELCFRALEDAGIAPSSLAGSDTGVFVGVSGSEHALLLAADPARVDADFGLGHAASIVASRVSYQLDLRGPSSSHDAACASSLAALHAARQSLQSGECDLALVAGVHALFAPHAQRFMAAARLTGQRGLCRAFDRAADGLARGEGCGVLVLRRLPDALDARDRIYALVSGSALSHAGAVNGLAAPSGAAQLRVLRRALVQARITPAELDCIEAHGVGTPLADGVEIAALSELLAQAERAAPCWVGSVKTNLGHLEAASGAAGLIKAALMLQRERIPAHLHLTQPIPELERASRWLSVPRQSVRFPRAARARHVGVSSFALGGSVAHAVLREAPLMAAAARARPAQVFTLSARSPAGLRALAQAHARALPGLPLAAACQVASGGRDHHPLRRAFVVRDTASLLGELRALEAGPLPPPAAGPVRVAFALAAGPVRPALVQALAASEPCYGAARERALGWLGAEPRARELEPLRQSLSHTHALLELFASWNLRPSAILAGPHTRSLAAGAAGLLRPELSLQLAWRESQPESRATALLDLFALARSPARCSIWLWPHGWLEVGQRPDLRWLTAPEGEPDAAAPGDIGCEAVMPVGPFPAPRATGGARWLEGPSEDPASLLRSLAALYELGLDLDWRAIERAFLSEKVSLPGYPLERVTVVPAFHAGWQRGLTPDLRRSMHPLLRRMTYVPNEEPSPEAASVPGTRTLR